MNLYELDWDTIKVWIVREYVAGRRQTDIAIDVGVSSAVVCNAITQFAIDRGVDFRWRYIYNEERRKLVAELLSKYFASNPDVALPPPSETDGAMLKVIIEKQRVWKTARLEHAWLLRAEGYSLQEIGDRLGLSRERVRQMILKFGRRVASSLNRSRPRILIATSEEENPNIMINRNPPAVADEPRSWRCFHCDEVFTDRAEAANHFGADEGRTCACLLPHEKHLVEHIRDLELELDCYRDDRDKVMLSIMTLESEIPGKVRTAEEEGYAKGVADGGGCLIRAVQR